MHRDGTKRRFLKNNTQKIKQIKQGWEVHHIVTALTQETIQHMYLSADTVSYPILFFVKELLKINQFFSR